MYIYRSIIIIYYRVNGKISPGKNFARLKKLLNININNFLLNLLISFKQLNICSSIIKVELVIPSIYTLTSLVFIVDVHVLVDMYACNCIL